MSRELNFSVTQPQADFLKLDCMFPAFVAGVGAGKSHAMAVSAVLDASHSSSAIIGLYEPTHHHIKTIILPKIEEILIDNGIRYNYNKQDHVLTTMNSQFGDFVFRSLDNPTLIVGYECYRSHIDELDVLAEDKAREAWMKVLARNRQRPKGITEVKNRVSAYSTPEGYKFVYKMWKVKQNPDYKMIQAPTNSNPYLTPAYEQSLRDSFPPEKIEAYLKGEFVNLNAATVYTAFSRESHNSNHTIQPEDVLFIGCDFNVNHQAATVYVKRHGGMQWHAVAELTEMRDTPEMIRIIKEEWQSKGHSIVIYPDASGTARKSVNASESDIALLKQAEFEVRAHRKNPLVKDRVQATNVAFAAGKIFINLDKCPTVARCLEQQSYDTNGEPDKKSGVDHQNDATTYPIAYEMPVKKSLFSIDFSFVV